MDINPQSAKPISDDQELAKVLAGVSQQADEALQFETTPVVTTPAPLSAPADDAVASTEEASANDNSDNPIVGYNPPVVEETPAAATTPELAPSSDSSSSMDLSEIKKDALNDLRPLVDKLEIAPDEKFDTYLLLIRSTDDKSLVSPAYAAAQAITDEARRAQALLDIIKEIDYLSNPPK